MNLPDLTSTDDVSFDDLDALLAESIQEKEAKLKVKTARQMMASSGIEPEVRAANEKYVREWELRREWTPLADVAMFHRQVCSCCGQHQVHFGGIFQRQQHRSSAIARWIQSDSLANLNLPKEVKIEDAFVPMCCVCAVEKGYK